MKSLMEQYFEEKYASRTIASDDHFVVYDRFDDGSVYIRHMYIKPESRGKGRAKEIEDSIVKKEAAISIWCDIDRTSNNWEEVLGMFLFHGSFKIDSIHDDKIILYRNVKDER